MARWVPTVTFDGGDLDCGSGLLLLIRQHLDPLREGELLEIRSTEISVDEDLPAWCRMTRNELVSQEKEGRQSRFLLAKGPFVPPKTMPGPTEGTVRVQAPLPRPVVTVAEPAPLPEPASAPAIPRLAVTGIGSWPRPRWLLAAMHQHLQGQLADDAFEETADDAVRLAVNAQIEAGVDVLTDGEQRRDNYASFVGAKLQNCQLVPIVDLLPYVDDPAAFRAELDALDVPAEQVRHPAVFGRLGRDRPLAVHELRFMQTLSERPTKIALPGPYLLTRTMWMECISDWAYADREALSEDVVAVLRQEIAALLAAGASLVQLDEPVLSEVVFGSPSRQRSFMCGALGERKDAGTELGFAEALLRATTDGFPRERLALHVCRGNWSPDESVALRGDYEPLLPFLSRAPVGALLLEACTDRAGDMALLRAIPDDKRLGVGLVNQKLDVIEPFEAVLPRAQRALALFGADRLILHPDCGFATFADNPIASARVAAGKLAVLARVASALR
jgi:5-methyltetrahydropteroyltriglutamate--homocysteine methyltransferase